MARASLQAELAAAVSKAPPAATPDGRRLDFKNRTAKGFADDGSGTPSHAFADEAYDELRALEVLRIEADRAEGLASVRLPVTRMHAPRSSSVARRALRASRLAQRASPDCILALHSSYDCFQMNSGKYF